MVVNIWGLVAGLMLASVAAQASVISSSGDTSRTGGTLSAEDAKLAFHDPIDEQQSEAQTREEKFLSVFQIVQFKNEACSATDGNTGTCFTAAECTSKGGVATGSCASGFGVCCVFVISECGGSITTNNAYITNPGYPAAAPTGMCMYTINKCDSSICQYRIEFEDVEISQPASGSCTNDTLMLSGFDAVSEKVVPGTLCGKLTGQHVIANVASTDPSKITFNIVSSSAKWKIKVVQLACTDENLAPAGCVTYNTEGSGQITSYNHEFELINDQMFSHCIKPQDGFCDVQLDCSSGSYNLGGTSGNCADYVSFGGVQTCGTTLGTNCMLAWNFTGPYVIPTVSDSDNSGMVEGYNIAYTLLPC